MRSLINYHFGNKVPSNGVGVAYVQSNPIYSSDAITLVDTSAIIAQNSFFQQNVIIDLKDNNLNYYVDKRGFFLTDRFNKNGKPLYFKHKLDKDIFTGTDISIDVIIMDSNDNQISSSFYTYDCGNKTVYHSLPVREDKAYFVEYPRADSNNQIIESRYKELLKTTPAFEEADADDIDDCGLDPDKDGYILTELDGQPYFFRLRLPRPSIYSLRYTDEGLLRLHIPKQSQQEPWYIEIQNSTILTNHVTQNTFLKYNISEFDQQSFYPFAPIKFETNIDIHEVAEGVFDLGFKNIVVNNKTPIDILIFDSNNNLTRAFSTDTNKNGKKQDNVFWETDGIIGIDKAAGRVKIYRSIQNGEQATANFFHETNKYTYTKWNFNPTFNTDALSKRVAILIKPDSTDSFNSVSHVVINADKTIYSASDTNISAWIDATKTFDNLIADWIYIPGTSETNQKNYMMLGIISTHTPISPNQLLTFDARIRGGGIIDYLQEQALNLMPGANNNWDIGNYDGPPVPIHGGILIYLPKTLLNKYTEKQLRALASKYSAAGTYIIIKYY